jgi:hypothetical protein
MKVRDKRVVEEANKKMLNEKAKEESENEFEDRFREIDSLGDDHCNRE